MMAGEFMTSGGCTVRTLRDEGRTLLSFRVDDGEIGAMYVEDRHAIRSARVALDDDDRVALILALGGTP